MLKGVYKNLNILVGLIFGYILSIIFTVAGIAPMVDFSGIQETIDQVGFFSSRDKWRDNCCVYRSTWT